MPLATAGEFSELRETILHEQADLDRILASSGRRLGSRNEPAYLAKLAEATAFIADVMSGHTPAYRLQEALSTSDFPLLMGDVLDRQLLGRYADIAPEWPKWAKPGTVRDFRTVRRIQLDGLEGSFYPSYPKPELTEGKEGSLSETGYTYAVSVYEKQFAISWQALVNDDLDSFASIPDRLARGARRTEDKFAAGLFVSSTGPNATIYSVAHKNLVSTANGAAVANPPLSISGLQDAMVVLANMVDADGEPVAIGPMTLVVPPGLAIVAENILNATMIFAGGNAQVGGGGVAAQQLQVANWMRGRLTLSVEPYLSTINTTSGATAWYLFANPNESRPALEVGFLRGYETPGIYKKAADMVRMGAGAPAEELGSFDTGEMRWKGMHIIGGTALDYRTTVASTGAGS